MHERYHVKFMAAAVRGGLKRLGKTDGMASEILEKPLDALTEEETETVLRAAEGLPLKLHYFKKTDRLLPRVHKVLGFLKGISFESLLDVGSGRGVFLLPFLEEFPYAETYSVDVLDHRIEMLRDIAEGGLENLHAEKADICQQPYADRSFDVVTLLEVLEHIPDVEGAIRLAVKMAKKYIAVSVPSKEDDNPEHIHLLTKQKLTEYFHACGVHKLRFDGVPGHLIMIATIGGGGNE